MRAECVQCGKPAASDKNNAWQPGEWLLFGSLYCCSKACGLAWSKASELPDCDLYEPAAQKRERR